MKLKDVTTNKEEEVMAEAVAKEEVKEERVEMTVVIIVTSQVTGQEIAGKRKGDEERQKRE